VEKNNFSAFFYLPTHIAIKRLEKFRDCLQVQFPWWPPENSNTQAKTEKNNGRAEQKSILSLLADDSELNGDVNRQLPDWKVR
jgi:hypothetical protein